MEENWDYKTKELFRKICQEKNYALLDTCDLNELRTLYKYFLNKNQKQTPLVSVLVATYKTSERDLSQCISSILAQTYTNFELLILDDGSEDENLKKVIEKCKDSRVFSRYNQKNLGIAKTRNVLLQWAKGKYLAVMDSDDIMLPERLEKQVIYMELNPTVGICGIAYQRFGNWKKKGSIFPAKDSDEIKAGLFFKCAMHHPGVMLRSDIVKNKQITYNDNYISVNDRHLYLDMMPYTEFHNLPQILMRYRMHPNSVSRRKRMEIKNEQKELRKEMLAKMNIELSPDELELLNNFVLNGNCRIQNVSILKEIEKLLSKLDKANEKSGYFPKEAFSKLCALYLVKRCLNASVYGRISSTCLLRKTDLPVEQIKIPLILKILNILLPRKMD